MLPDQMIRLAKQNYLDRSELRMRPFWSPEQRCQLLHGYVLALGRLVNFSETKLPYRKCWYYYLPRFVLKIKRVYVKVNL